MKMIELKLFRLEGYWEKRALEAFGAREGDLIGELTVEKDGTTMKSKLRPELVSRIVEACLPLLQAEITGASKAITADVRTLLASCVPALEHRPTAEGEEE